MQKIVPNLWYDKEAKEAADFYVSVFGNGSKINSQIILKNTPSGDCDLVSFNLLGFEFLALSAGPIFKLNPSISFFVNCQSSEEIDSLWEKLSQNGKVLMEYGNYPFAEKYGWTEDKYGVSWQLILVKPQGKEKPRIIPSLMFVGDVFGKAMEAEKFYASIFEGNVMGNKGETKLGDAARYGEEMGPQNEGKVMYSELQLGGVWFAAMDGAGEHKFKFNEAVSLIIKCKNQEEIDYFWEKLSAVTEAEQCGWLKDKFGVSWQISPIELDEMMISSDQEKVDRVTQATLNMKKLDILELRKAYQGE